MVCDASGAVMRKSRANATPPIPICHEHGVDITRLAMYFAAPSDKEMLWSNDFVVGVEKFVNNRLYPLMAAYRGTQPDLKRYYNRGELTDAERSVYVKLNQTIKKVSESFERFQFNTAVSAVMELLRDFEHAHIDNDQLNDCIVLKASQLIAPLAPHIAEEIWEVAGSGQSVFKSDWPDYDPEAIVGETIEIAVQVNGKLRDSVEVPADADQAAIEEAALGRQRIQSYLTGKVIVKKIFVPGRILNIVVRG
jgi:leucyl-tRNA synthetase